MKNIDKIDITDYLQKALDDSFVIYSSNISSNQDSLTFANVHDLRVSIRRFSSFLNFIDNFYGSHYITLLIVQIKKQLKLFSRLRDTHVMLDRIIDLRRVYTPLDHFLYELLAREQSQKNVINNNNDLLNIEDLDSWVYFLKQDMSTIPLINRPSLQNSIELVDRSYGKVLSSISNIKKENSNTIHRVRIRFKEFRYLLEHLNPLLSISEENFKSMKSFQTFLGDIQDLAVIINELESFNEIQKELPKTDLFDAISFLRGELSKSTELFLENTGLVYEFWDTGDKKQN